MRLLVTLGKVIGGGLPVGAYAGPAEFMDMVAPVGPVYQAGTSQGIRWRWPREGNALLSARNNEIYGRMERLAGTLVEHGGFCGNEADIPLYVQPVGSMFTWFFQEGR